MYRLVMDTAMDYSYMALLKDNDILYESYSLGKNNHSERVLPELEETLKNYSIKLKDIEEVYVGIGPGSYTGVRIATVIGKMIAVMNNIKLYKFSSLALLSTSVDTESYPFIDCRRGNCYTAHFIYQDGILTRLKEDSLEKIDEFFNGLNKELIVKEGKPQILKLLSSKEVILVDDPNSLSPNYLQLVEAERIKKGLQ